MSIPKIVVTSSIIALSTLSLQAIQFESLGYKSISMGGACVANSSGSAASYSNPALLAKTPYTVEVAVSAGTSAYDFGARDSLSELYDLDYIDTLNKAANDVNSLTNQERQELEAGTQVIVDMDAQAIAIDPQGYIGAHVGSFGFGVYVSSDSAITATTSAQHNKLYFDNNGNYTDIYNNPVTQTQYENESVEYAIENQLSYLDVVGASIAEVPLAYGYNFETNIGNIMVGGALKYMHAITYVETLSFDED